MKMRRQLALLVIGALLIGLLPMRNAKVSKAAEGTAQSGYGLNNPTTDSDGVTTWDCIWFGNYWQEDTNRDGKADKEDAKQPIKWRVLSINGNDAFLLADKNLDCQKYNDTLTGVTWETCTMRSWLNGYGAGSNEEGKDYSSGNFLDYAFTSAEQSAINTTNVVNNDNPYYDTEGGNDTSDKVYLLSLEEVLNPVYGFSSDCNKYDKSRRAKNTEYAKTQGVWTSDDEYADNGHWWLRSSGFDSDNAAHVQRNGYVDRFGYNVYYNYEAARPALHLNLSSTSSWSYAGAVTSEGGGTGTVAPTLAPTVKPTTTPGTVSPSITESVSTPMPTAQSGYGLNNPTTDSDGVTTWDCIWFGNYWQEDTNRDGKADKEDAKQPIKWRVLSVNGDDAFLLADKNLDCQKYNDTRTSITWEKCRIRSWLNGYGAGANKEGKDYTSGNFLDYAFTSAEQSAINTTNVVNNDNPDYNTEGGNDTSDKVYLLSSEEVVNPVYGFPSDYSKYDKSRRAKNTEYAETQGVCGTYYDYIGIGDWWLRSPGAKSDSALYVSYTGFANRYGHYAYYDNVAVRPALHLNLSSTSSWSYAGAVTSEGGEIGTVTPTTTPTSTAQSGYGLNNPTTDSDGVTTWDCIWFGNYWQEDTNGDGKADKEDAKQPIKWRVLSVNGDDAFLLADKNLDCQKYNDTLTGVTWETCTLRSWLNGYGAGSNQEYKDYRSVNFLAYAFTLAERSAIRTTTVVNNDNSYYGIGNDTSDKVYLLSLKEMMNPAYGFSADDEKYDKNRRAKNTEYAKTQRVWTSASDEHAGNGYWWLRSPGISSNKAAYVSYDGYVDPRGGDVNHGRMAVRPALHLNLSSTSSWSYAGTVTTTLVPTVEPTTTPDSTPTSTAQAGYGLNNPTTDSDGVTTWDCIWFGNYWQEDTNGDGKADKEDAKQPIKWRVLSVNGDNAFLLADKNLDCQKYNDTYTGVTWETCTMRSWLNGYGAGSNQERKDYSSGNFLDYAFTSAEQSAIRTTNVMNNDNPYYDTEGGNDTSDKVYLLSLEEVRNPVYGFSSDYSKFDKSRRAKNTEYANSQGVFSTSDEYADNGQWWLRSRGESDCAVYVSYTGYVNWSGYDVDYDNLAVRPALHLNLSSTSSWSYAGAVTSEGGEAGTVTPTLAPTVEPTTTPGTVSPSSTESPSETSVPTEEPGATATAKPIFTATVSPATTVTPVSTPIVTQTPLPTEKPTPGATVPIVSASPLPGVVPTKKPEATSTAKPSVKPTLIPGTEKPGVIPTEEPSVKPTPTPGTEKPETTPTPTEEPSVKPTLIPETEKPGVISTEEPSVKPTPTLGAVTPEATPTGEPSAKPTPTLETETPEATPTSTEEPFAKPTPTPGAVTLFPTESPLQMITPVLQPQEPPSVSSVGKVASIKLKQKKKTVTASWKKVPGVIGYQICYSTSKKWKGKKQKLLRKNKVTVKNLKKKKTYYFRVRAYRLEGTKKIYGAWSKTKRIRMKK